ncbi:formate/nitrite transporter family protein [Pontibacter cellulosilyticus]|uniref:Formate/nitrite transporter family protein n=1 Tax=Pontibacter cellulosilyticus TaxID=1720253 RepID=A0A923N3M1_9BACT|nr:formate/nitrite transporter family protein [Pontibacter cellulosilyticus]MBC5992280.1 formate/nitrite transporter family protein [Pontibacter cellulosilyticus]
MPEQPTEDTHKKDANLETSPSAKDIHDAISLEAESELSRPSAGLFWSGIAAGSSMGFSMVAEGLLEAYLPDAKWSVLVSSFGYSLGFVIVILGKQQLFTENTLTPVLPLFQRRDLSTLWNVMRLWGIVLFANLAGAWLFSIVAAETSVFPSHVLAEFEKIGKKAMEPGAYTTFMRGIFAGWLIALMVWLLPYAKTARVWVIVLITYVIAIGHFSHVIAGSIETFTLVAMQKEEWGRVLWNYTIPTLLGNIAGGVILVAALNFAQINAGIDREEG